MTRLAIALVLLFGCHKASAPDAGSSHPLIIASELAPLGLKGDPTLGSFHVDRSPDGRVEVNYEYRFEKVSLADSLNLEVDAAAAQKFYDDMLSGQQLILGKDNLTMGSCPADASLDKILKWGDQGACFLVSNEEGPVGFFLQAKKGARIYLLMLFAPGIVELEPKVLALAASRLDALTTYAP